MLLASALSALSLIGAAQITVTNATFPSAGDSLSYAVDDLPLGMNPATPPGGGQTWDFSALQKDNLQSLVYKNASTGQNASQFPGAELVILGQLGETYINKTNSSFEIIGYSGQDPTGFGIPNIVAKFQPNIVERYSPMNFFDIKSPSTSLTLTFPTDQPPLDSLFSGLPVNIDSLRIRQNTNRIEVVDGWGTMSIPGGSYPVLRQKRTDYTSRAIDVYVLLFPGFGNWVDLSTLIGGGGGGGLGNLLGTDTTVTYNFYNDGQKEIIASATMQNDLSTVQSIQFKNNPSTPVFEVYNDFPANIQAFPNPAVEWVRFDCTNLPQGDYTLKIFNIIGKCIWKRNYTLSGTTSFKVDLDDFKKGTYIYSLVDKDGKSMGTKRLVVLKP